MSIPHDCQTVSDARTRVLYARIGSLAPDATMEYLLELANGIRIWQENVAAEIHRKSEIHMENGAKYARKMQQLYQ